jgi:hypothetical protein
VTLSWRSFWKKRQQSEDPCCAEVQQSIRFIQSVLRASMGSISAARRAGMNPLMTGFRLCHRPPGSYTIFGKGRMVTARPELEKTTLNVC